MRCFLLILGIFFFSYSVSGAEVDVANQTATQLDPTMDWILDKSEEDPFTDEDYAKEYPLHAAAKENLWREMLELIKPEPKGRFTAGRIWIRAGESYDVNARDSYRWTPLQLALRFRNVEAILNLMAHPNIDLTLIDDDGNAALAQVIRSLHPDFWKEHIEALNLILLKSKPYDLRVHLVYVLSNAQPEEDIMDAWTRHAFQNPECLSYVADVLVEKLKREVDEELYNTLDILPAVLTKLVRSYTVPSVEEMAKELLNGVEDNATFEGEPIIDPRPESKKKKKIKRDSPLQAISKERQRKWVKFHTALKDEKRRRHAEKNAFLKRTSSSHI